jgi:hypothetical protein
MLDGCASLYRTSNPTYTTYRGDGQGRDSYAIVGNGGLVRPDAFKNVAPSTGYNHRYVGSAFSIKPSAPAIIGKKNATAERYWGNGAGRETYILVNCGGGIEPYSSKSPQAGFYQSLRTYKHPADHI